jgi:hypothetical protein
MQEMVIDLLAVSRFADEGAGQARATAAEESTQAIGAAALIGTGPASAQPAAGSFVDTDVLARIS